MNGSLLRQVRIDQSCRRLDHLRESIEQWLVRRGDEDRLRQYDTQLKVLGGSLTGSIAGLRRVVEGLTGAEMTGQVYATCRTTDTRAELVRRVFDYYRGKFDQRDDHDLRPVLLAADEVVWSCWAEPFRNAQRDDQELLRGPAPLPYIEPRYSPAAVPREDPPADLVSERDDPVLAEYLQRLPIPVIGLPAVCTDDPWWLVYVGHEVGHHLQHDLAERWRLVKAFGDLVEKTSQTMGAADPGQWRSWSQEIFADLCSICTMGSAAVYGIVQLELDTEDRMLQGKAKYPPPLLRLAILARAAACLGVDTAAALAPVDLDRFTGDGAAAAPGQAEVARQLRVGTKLAEAALADTLEARGPFEKLFGWDQTFFSPGGLVWSLQEGLRNRAPLNVEPAIRSARLLTSAAVAAWEEVATIDHPDQREEERGKLAQRFLPAVLASREEQTRAVSPTAQPDIPALADELTRLLIETVPESTGH